MTNQTKIAWTKALLCATVFLPGFACAAAGAPQDPTIELDRLLDIGAGNGVPKERQAAISTLMDKFNSATSDAEKLPLIGPLIKVSLIGCVDETGPIKTLLASAAADGSEAVKAEMETQKQKQNREAAREDWHKESVNRYFRRRF